MCESGVYNRVSSVGDYGNGCKDGLVSTVMMYGNNEVPYDYRFGLSQLIKEKRLFVRDNIVTGKAIDVYNRVSKFGDLCRSGGVHAVRMNGDLEEPYNTNLTLAQLINEKRLFVCDNKIVEPKKSWWRWGSQGGKRNKSRKSKRRNSRSNRRKTLNKSKK